VSANVHALLLGQGGGWSVPANSESDDDGAGGEWKREHIVSRMDYTGADDRSLT